MRVTLCVFFIGVFLIGDAFSWGDWGESRDDDYEVDPSESDDEAGEGDYFVIHFVENGGTVNTEENEVETGEERPKPDEDVEAIDNSETESVNPDIPHSDTTLDVLSEKLDKLLSDFKAQQDKITGLEEANRKLILKIDSIEQQVKTNSVILTNVREQGNETSKTTLQRVLHVLNRVMKVRVSAGDVAVALRAEGNSPGGNRPIVVRFTNFATKMKVLAASNRLAHTDMTVSSDYSELVARTRSALVPYLQQARAEGRHAYILYDKLVVDGVAHTLDQLRARAEAEAVAAAEGEGEELMKVEPCRSPR